MLAGLAAGLTLMNVAAASTEITVYNQGFGLVKEVRRLELKAGRQTVNVENVAAMIEPTSVGIRNLSANLPFEVLEQNYQFDLISPAAILAKSVGKRVRVVQTVGNQRVTTEGVLLSVPTPVPGVPNASTSGLVIRTDDGRILLDPAGEIEVREVPEGLISVPTLLWDLDADAAGTREVEVSYLTQGISWSADYVLTLGEGDAPANLRGWVTINNQSGATYRDAKLKLLAGDVERARPETPPMARAMAADAVPGGRGGFQQEALFEYHLYTLQRPATVRNREIKQLSLLESAGVKARKRLIVDATLNFGRYFPSEGEIGTGDIKPQVRVEFTNDAASGLGVPLPKGTVKVYQRDRSGSVQMLGEDRIEHTPREEALSLVVGRSFDIVANRRRTEFRRLGDRGARETFEIEVRNRKETAETVIVLERPWGEWKLTANSQNFIKRNSNAIEFEVKLNPNEVKTITYTIETRW